MSVVRIAGVVALTIVLAGCATPCFYKGKAVPRLEAERMRRLGMDVTCN